MDAPVSTYTVTKKYKWKAFRIPADMIEIDGRYTAEDIPGGVRFVKLDGGPYRVIGEAIGKGGKPRYGIIKFVDPDKWEVGTKYTVSGNGAVVELVEVK